MTFTPPHVRRQRDGSLYITDGAVIDMRERAAEPRREGHATRRRPVLERVREMREEMGI